MHLIERKYLLTFNYKYNNILITYNTLIQTTNSGDISKNL